MTGPERNDLRELRVDLFGDDGQGGAIGAINAKLSTVEAFYLQAVGVLRVVKWLGAGITFAIVGKVIGIV